MDLLEASFKAIKADTQLLFSSDWPHWDFDLPSAITKLPFIDDKAKRQTLGLNAARACSRWTCRRSTNNSERG